MEVAAVFSCLALSFSFLAEWIHSSAADRGVSGETDIGGIFGAFELLVDSTLGSIFDTAALAGLFEGSGKDLVWDAVS